MTQTRSRIEAAPLGWLLVSRIVAGMITRDRKWVGTLPLGLETSATVDALRAICELDQAPGWDRASGEKTLSRGRRNRCQRWRSLHQVCGPDPKALEPTKRVDCG